MKIETLSTDPIAQGSVLVAHSSRLSGPSWGRSFCTWKRSVDVGLALAVLPMIVVVGSLLLVLNPISNRGPLLFSQYRMGQGGRRFRMWKFRTMRPVTQTERDFKSPVEISRVTPLGAVMRRSRIDELPNFFNVLAGDMSFVGPRPDTWEHAMAYCRVIPRYSARHAIRPGITGLAQIRSGYADTLDQVRRKARLDAIYMRSACLRLDLRIAASTLGVMLRGSGAK